MKYVRELDRIDEIEGRAGFVKFDVFKQYSKASLGFNLSSASEISLRLDLNRVGEVDLAVSSA